MMNRTVTELVRRATLSLILGLTALQTRAASPDFQEVYDLLKANLPGMDEPGLQRAAVEGLLSNLGGRATLLGSSAPAPVATSKEPVFSRLIEDRFAYLRLPSPDSAVAGAEQALTQFASSNRLQGGVLDLRFAKGTDFAAAASLASLFVSGNKPLLDWGTGVVNSTGRVPVGKVPWVVLVNSETAGSAEALAAALRQTETALVVGGKTAGQAATYKEFTLKSGQRLSIASKPVKTGDGKEITGASVSPDIDVVVDAGVERSAMRDFENGVSKEPVKKSPTSATTTKSSRRRINEAELVRLQREGKRTDVETVSGAAASSDSTPAEAFGISQDATFSRALDLLKGLAVVRQSKGS